MALKGNIGKFKYEISSETAGPSTPHEYNTSIGGGNLNIKFDPTELATGASAMSPKDIKPLGFVPQRQLENFPLIPAPTLSKTPADNVTNLVPETLPPTTIKPTDHVTSDGQSIQSAFGSAQDFYSQISMNDIVDNTPSGAMSYAGYLAYNGLVDPRQQYAEDLDAANEMYARALGTYGMAGEGLAQGNLVNSGYSEYLNGNAYTQKAGWYRQALVDYQNRQNEYGAKYAQYKNDLAAQQAEDDAQKDLPSEQSVNAYNYLLENVQNAGGLEAAKRYLAANGYTAEDIDAAIKNWQSTYQADTQSNIDRITSLASGNAAALKQQYGSGEEYNKALAALQKKNGEMLEHFFEAEDFNDPMFYDFLAQYESEDGESAFDDMNDGDKVLAFRDYVKKLYQSGDISKEQYHAFNAKSLVGAIKEHLSDDKTSELSNGVFKAAVGATTGLPAGDLPQYKGGQGFLGAFEELAKFGGSGSLGEKGLEQAYNELANKMSVKFLKNGSPYEVTYINSKGKKMTMDMDQLYLRTPEQRKAFYAFAEWYKNKKA